jgi:hypothetical protein
MNENAGRYVWFKEKDTSRSPYAAFRKSFFIKDTARVKEAELHIFADTVYALYVNGCFTGFGPVRFDPRFPQYDTYDLNGLLRDGDNTIAALVNFHGHKVFKSIPAQAAMLAWGKVVLPEGLIDLKTGNDAEPWKCRQHTAYTRYTPKLSFALDTQSFYDQKIFDENWIQPDYDDGAWQNAVLIKDNKAFGSLTPRQIPFMELTPKIPASVALTPLLKTERLYSFYYEPPIGYDTAFDIQREYDKTVEWETSIYSPRAQAVTAGVLYEALSLNGKPCKTIKDPFKPLRYNAVLMLNEGWNKLSAKVELFQDIYEGYLALPDGRGLIVSVDEKIKGGRLFRYSPLRKDKETGHRFTKPDDIAESPCREASWDSYAAQAETLEPADLHNFVARKDLYPDGFMLTVKMAHMSLVIPQIKLTGAAGATVDFVYGDRLAADGQHIQSLSWVPLGDRVKCSHDTLQWQPLQPRGFKYLGITVRNAQGDVCIDKISFLSAQYPVARSGSFECSDPLLNRIWEMGAVTQAINMEDAYVDCVDRERGLYALDALIQYKVNLACFGDHALMKRSMELFGQSTHPIGLFRCLYPNTGDYILPDFCLYIVNAFYAYFKQTKDTAFITRHWPAIMQNMQVFHRLSDERADKLLNANAPAEGWPRNPTDKRTGFLGDGERTDNTGINCLFSCLYLIALREALEMAVTINAHEASDLADRVALLSKSIPEVFWNEERGLFADTVSHERFSAHASLFAVNADAATEEIRQRLCESLPPMLSPFFTNGFDHTDGILFETSQGYYFLTALYKLGLYEAAEGCIKEGWGYFLAKGLTTAPEHFNLRESQCHAWTAHPTYFLSRHVLGVEADATTVKISPKPGRVTWAKGTFPHALGLIEVEWHKKDGQIVFDRLVLPQGLELSE